VQILKYDDLMMYTYTFVTTSLDFVMVSSSTVGESNLLFRCKTSRKKNPINSEISGNDSICQNKTYNKLKYIL
jgi:hypothetical protein